MLLFNGAGGLLVIALWIFCCLDVLFTPENACRSLPKLAWVFLVLLLPLIGSIAWLIAGRPWTRAPGQNRAAGPRATQGAARGVSAKPSNPDDDEEFIASLRKRADEQRRHDGPDSAAG